MLRRSDSIDSWKDNPKHPITVKGTNKFLTNGGMITETENKREFEEISFKE